jgi:glycosyltransferase involved in cell wall biosynthesis
MENKLSIGIPTYNQGEYLEIAILSVLNQTVKPYEFIVCNNHSTDGLTELILAKYSDKIKIISPPKHLGLMENFDFLARHFTGDWVAFTCSDDYLSTDFVEVFQKNLNQNAVLHRFGYNSIDKNGKIVKKNYIRSVRKNQGFPGNYFEQLSGSKGSIGSTVFKLETLKKINYFDLNLKLNGDWSLFLKFAPEGSFEYINRITGNVRLDYRPNLTVERFEADTDDQLYIYSVLQKSIINKYNLSSPFIVNALKIRLYSIKKIAFANKIDSSKSVVSFQQYVPNPHIKSNLEFFLRKNIQRIFEVFIKK